MTVNFPSMLDVIRFGEAQEEATIRQYARHLERMFSMRGYKERHLGALDGTLEVYLQVAPRYGKRNHDLTAKIRTWGIKPATYRQYQTDGRRMIEAYTGDLRKRLARRQKQDGFARLNGVLPDLLDAALIKPSQARNLPRLVDLARARGWDISDITRDRIVTLREDCPNSDEWGRVKRGAALLDYLRQFPTCLPLLPPAEIGSLAGVLRLDTTIPDFLDDETQTWVRDATVAYHDDMLTPEARVATAREYSESSKGVYRAALRSYIREVRHECAIESVNGLTSLFRPELIEKTIIRLCKASETRSGLSPRTLFSYALVLKRLLASQGLQGESAKVERLIKSLPVLVQGQAATKMMSPRVEEWCRELLADPVAMEIFETQHFRYVEKALAALELAELEGIDLLAYARTPGTQALSKDRSRLAENLLRQARMFGVCAAFAAIELEGAPFRKSNVIRDLKMAGHPRTFFDHRSDGRRPRLEIHIPNELLKNGESMTKRNQHMPRFVFEKHGLGREGFEILSFYLSRIRPLFCGSEHSDHLFPAIDAEPRPLVMSTFDGWLAEYSEAVGLFLLPHNFRHGICTIEIFHDPKCYPELETVTGDTVETLRRHYTFIDRERQNRSLQEKRYERRAMRTPFVSASAEVSA